MGKAILDESGIKEGKLIFLMRVGPDQFNSGLFDPNPPLTFIGVYASTIRQEFSLNPHNSTLSRGDPSITIHEAKKFLHYLIHERPSMLELLFTTRDHYMTPEWEILRNNVRKIVSLQFAQKILQIVQGNIDNACQSKYKRNPTRAYNTFFIATRMLDTVESLMKSGEISLQTPSQAYLDEILKGKFDTDTLYNHAKTKMSTLEEAIKQNQPNLNATTDLAFLNEWLIETIRRPTL